MKEFSNDDLKAGMLVELTNGVKGILIPVEKELEVFGGNLRTKTLSAKTNAYLMTDNITNIIDKDFAIIKVWGLCKNYDLFNTKYRELLWEYEQPKEMTIEQIEKILGYKIKIVRGGENDRKTDNN